MVTHVVLPEALDDRDFWQTLRIGSGDRLDLRPLGSDVSCIVDAAANVLTLRRGAHRRTIGGGGSQRGDACFGAGHVASLAEILCASASSGSPGAQCHDPAHDPHCSVSGAVSRGFPVQRASRGPGEPGARHAAPRSALTDDPDGRLPLSGFENLVPCFAAGTLIRTAHGDIPVEDLRPGESVLTRDNGFQALLAIAHRHLDADDLAAAPHLDPIRIAPSALGDHQPSLPLRVARTHKVLLNGRNTALPCATSDVLVAACHLLDWDCVDRAVCNEITFVHLLFERREILLTNGAWTESFQPGIATADPHLAGALGHGHAVSPRPSDGPGRGRTPQRLDPMQRALRARGWGRPAF